MDIKNRHRNRNRRFLGRKNRNRNRQEKTEPAHPYYIVVSDTTNQFKNRLDKFWQNQDMIYDYTADMTGIGNRSESVA